MSRASRWTLIVALTSAVALGLGLPPAAQWVGLRADPEAYRILTLNVPTELRAGEEYVRTVMRICPTDTAGAPCRFQRRRNFTANSRPTWRSLGAAKLSPGTYRGHVTLLAETRLGAFRTVATQSWDLHVR
jgi:hypothetical protein